MSELPSGWAACTLGDIVERIETGKSVKCEERPPQGDENGLVKISAVTWGEFDEQESKTLFDSSHLKPEEKIQLGDFLISRANTLELVGSCVLVKKISKSLYLSDKVLRLVLPDEAKSWLLVCLRSQAGRKQIENLATGNQLSMRNISQQALREIRIPLPPLAEQTRIAAKLNELLAQVDTLKARIDGIPALLKRFRQSVLAAAVSGQLTEEWRSTCEGEGQDLPLSWATPQIKDVGRVQLGRQRSPKYHSGANMRPYLRVQNVFEDRIDLADVMEMDFPGADFEKYKLHCGDILLNEGQSPDLLGRPAMFRGEIEGACFTNTLIRFQAGPDLAPQYALFVFRHYMHSGRFRSIGSITTNIAHLGAGRFAELPFPLPPLAEQTEIVRRVEQLFAFADQLEAKVNEAKTRIDRLTQSILAKAFRGELVPQDPDDEPASALLERIQAQRASAPKAKRGRRKAETA